MARRATSAAQIVQMLCASALECLPRGSTMRIRPICLALLLAAMLGATPAASQNWPSRPVTLIVPYAAGGSVDVVARVVAGKLGERLGQTVVIENVAGAGGHHRDATRGPRRAGWLYAPVFGREHDGDRQARAAHRREVRQLEGFPADQPDRRCPAGARRQEGVAGRQYRRADGAAPAKSRQVQFRQLRRRHIAAAGRR